MRYLRLLIFLPPLLLGIAGAVFTSNKLHRMRQVRGWDPGAIVKPERVRDKWHDEELDAFWISLTRDDVQCPGHHRLDLPPETWARYRVGDPIQIIYLPSDSTPYHRRDIYADDSNFQFDQTLLLIESCLALGAIAGAAFTLRAVRRASR